MLWVHVSVRMCLGIDSLLCEGAEKRFVIVCLVVEVYWEISAHLGR